MKYKLLLVGGGGMLEVRVWTQNKKNGVSGSRVLVDTELAAGAGVCAVLLGGWCIRWMYFVSRVDGGGWVFIPLLSTCLVLISNDIFGDK